MERNEWDLLACDIEEAWPTLIMNSARRDVFFDRLADLPEQSVAQAIRTLAAGVGGTAPSPDDLREVALGHAGLAHSGAEPVPAKREESVPDGVIAIIVAVFLAPVGLILGIVNVVKLRSREQSAAAVRSRRQSIAAIAIGGALVAVGVGALALGDLPGRSGGLSDGTPSPEALAESMRRAGGAFRTEDGTALDVTSASCQAGTSSSTFTCVVEFDSATTQRYAATVESDGSWRAEPLAPSPEEMAAILDEMASAYEGKASNSTCAMISDAPALYHCQSRQPDYDPPLVVACYVQGGAGALAAPCPRGYRDDLN